MLLLVLQSQLHQVHQGRFVAALQQAFEGRVHPAPPLAHLPHRRTTQQAPLGTWLARTDGFVIGIEQVTPAGIGRFIARLVGPQHKGFEKPGGVGQMPFGGAGIGHPLKVEIFGVQRFDQGFTGMPHGHQPVQKRAGGHGGWAHWR